MIIPVITVDLSFYHILSCSIIFYHSIIPDSSLPDHSITPVAIDLLYLLVIEKPGADRIHLLILVNLPTFGWLQSVSARLRNNHVAGFSNMFYIVSTIKTETVAFFFNFNGSCCVYNYIYIYIYSTTQFGKPINSILSLTRHGSSDKSSNIGRLWQCVYPHGLYQRATAVTGKNDPT